MSLSYIIKEGFSGFSRARLASIASISTITISLILLGTFLLLALNAQRMVFELRERLEVEAFLDKTLTDKENEQIRAFALSIPGVKTADYITKEKAAEIFKKEFGENIYDIVDENPLPASIKIKVFADYGPLDSLKKIVSQLSKSASVTDVRFNEKYIKAIDQNANILWLITLGLGLIVSLASIFLVSNTIRLTIYAKRFLIQTMKLVGATTGFIRTPFLIEGFLQGVFSGALAVGSIYGLIYLVDSRIYPIQSVITVDKNLAIILISVGALLGLVGSLISVRKFITMRITE